MSEKQDFESGGSGQHEIQQQDGGPLGQPLSRQMTVALTPEQYERLFFQPNAPKGDLAKRLGNPSLLGLLGFLGCYTSTILILVQFQGAIPPYSLMGLSGDYYFLGVLAMVLAGVGEFVLGNTFPMTVFIIYGVHWGSLAYVQDASHAIVGSFEEYGGANGAVYNSSQGFHNVTMCLVSFIFMLGCLRVNLLFVLLFLGLVMLFAFIAAADFAVPTATTADDLAHIEYLLKIGGGFGFVGLICGWYLAIIEVCECVKIPCPLPVFDLSSKIFPTKKKES